VERTTDYAERLMVCMAAMPKPFGMMMVSHSQPILSLEDEGILRRNIHQRVMFGCAAQASVFLDPSTESLAKLQYRHIHGMEGLRHAIFDVVAAAAQWLIECGFTDVKGLRRREDLSASQQVARLG
jgi:hypothetical protein